MTIKDFSKSVLISIIYNEKIGTDTVEVRKLGHRPNTKLRRIG